MNKKNNKKGILFDAANILVFIILIALTFFVGKLIFNEVVGGFEEAAIEQGNVTGTNVNYSFAAGQMRRLEPTFLTADLSFLVIVIGLTLTLIFSAFRVNTHPIFIVINIVGIFLLIFLSIIYSFVFKQFTSDPVFLNSSFGLLSSAQSFPITSLIISNYPWFALFLVVVASIIMYAKGGGQNP